MRARRDDGQLTLVGIVIALVVLGALTGVGLTVFVSGSDNGRGAQGLQGPGVSQADNVAAQESLSQAQTAAATTGVANGYGSLNASAMAAIDPSVTFTAGASASSSTVSVASSGGGAGGGSGGGIGGVSASSLGSTGIAGSGGAGSVTFASHAKTGTCWYLWLGAGGPRYGAQTGQSSCQAAAILTAPAEGPVSSNAIGWAGQGWPAA